MSYYEETDLPPSLAPLKSVDTLLRCPICFDFLNISMMTKCSHNFCSLCIRKFLSYKLQCPVCNIDATEQDLRNNRLLDDLVTNFQAARKRLSNAMFESPPKTPSAPAVSVRCKTLKTPKSSSTVLSQYFQKKTPKESNKDVPTTQLIKEEPMDLELSSVQVSVPVKQEKMTAVYTGDESAHSSSSTEDVKPVIKVACPVCSVNVAQNFINKHLDMCLSSGEKKESLRSSLGKSRPLKAKLVYNLLSLQELKRRLKDCQLSVQGTRDQLIKRHQEFIHIYNAQSDSLNPRSAEDIAKEVEANEKMRTKLKEKTKPVMVFSKNLSENEIADIHSNYRKQHSGDFNRLIAQVRGRLQTSRSAGISAEREDVHKSAAEPQSSIVIDSEDSASGEESCFKDPLSSSPTCSEVSISSSLSDIFGPEPTQRLKHIEPPSSKQENHKVKAKRLKDTDFGDRIKSSKRNKTGP